MSKPTPRRFKATERTTQRDLQVVIKKLGATSLRVGQDFATGEAEISFDRAGRRYVFRCRRWPSYDDNLRAAQRTISLLHQASEEYGVHRDVLNRPGSSAWSAGPASGDTGADPDPFAAFFVAFEALPDDTLLLLGSGHRRWWEVLGVSERASRQEIVNAYRALARVHHPDVGGNPDDFKRLNVAYQEGIAQVGGAA